MKRQFILELNETKSVESECVFVNIDDLQVRIRLTLKRKSAINKRNIEIATSIRNIAHVLAKRKTKIKINQ